MKMPLSRAEAGLPEKAEVVRLLHNRGAMMTIVELKLAGGPPRHRIYLRRSDESLYQSVGIPTEEQSVEHATTSEAPLLFFSMMEWRQTGERVGGTPVGVFRVELADPTKVTPVDLDGVLPANAWIRSILRALDDGTGLDVVVAFKEGGPTKFEVRYAICRLDLGSRALIELAALPGVFF